MESCPRDTIGGVHRVVGEARSIPMARRSACPTIISIWHLGTYMSVCFQSCSIVVHVPVLYHCTLLYFLSAVYIVGMYCTFDDNLRHFYAITLSSIVVVVDIWCLLYHSSGREMSLSMSLDQDSSDFYSELDSTVTPSTRRRARASSLSRASDLTTDDDNNEGAAVTVHGHGHGHGHGSSSLATLTSFDSYFLHASRPARTSSNIFSQLVQPLSPDEYAASLSRSFYTHPFPPTPSSPSTQSQSQSQSQSQLRTQTGQSPLLEGGETAAQHRAYIPRYLLELEEGFNLLFYGFGSKRRALNDLARACAATATTTTTRSCYRAQAHVLVLNGFLPSFSARDLVAALARLPGAPQNVEDVAQFLNAEPTAPAPAPAPASTSRSRSRPPSTPVQNPPRQQQQQKQRRRRRLVLVVHNIDAPALRAPKVRALLNALASLRGVQIAASIDHINAPTIWTSTELLARKWLWHDLTTLAPYDVELVGSDPTSLRGGAPTTAAAAAAAAASATASMGAGGGAMMTETAARHVLAAVTQRARTLFMLMGRRQLDALADNAGSGTGGGGAGVVEPTTPAGAVEVAVPYDTLFNLARDNFVATNDTALRALLGEFRDHGLVVTVGTGAMGSGEMLWIPLRKERLTKLLDGLE